MQRYIANLHDSQEKVQHMSQANTGRGKDFSDEEDLQIVRLKAQRFTYAYIAMYIMTGRTARAVQSRHHVLEKDGRAADIRARLIDLGALPATA